MNNNCNCDKYLFCKSLNHACICNIEKNNENEKIKIIGMGFNNYITTTYCKYCNKFCYK